MVFFCEESVFGITLCLFCLCFIFYWYLTYNHNYWKKRCIAYVEPYFPFGTDKELVFLRVHIGHYFQEIYTSFKNEKVVGLYEGNNPYLLVRDIEIAKFILTNDFHYFLNRGFLDTDFLSPILKNLFLMEGTSWKIMRSKLTPAFTLGKTKLMFHLLEACTKELISSLNLSAERDGNVDIEDIIGRFTTDVIASCGFGLESNSILNPNCEFMKNEKILCKPMSTLEILKLKFAFAFPWLCKKLGFRLETMSQNFFTNIVTQTMRYRERKGIIRNDFVDYLIRLKGNTNLGKNDELNKLYGNKENETFNIDEIVAQATVFFALGLKNLVLTITFCLYEITRHPDIQSQVLNEVNEVLRKHSGVMSYQAVQDLSYLEAVISETLRRYPTLSILHRQCNEDYRVPGMNLTIEKGTKIVIPVYAFHHDSDYYPDPYNFFPERFLGNNEQNRKHIAYLPFGEGPRYCIGVLFSMVQMKLCIAEIIKNFQLSMSEHTPQNINISAKYFNTTSDTPIVLHFSKRIEK